MDGVWLHMLLCSGPTPLAPRPRFKDAYLAATGGSAQDAQDSRGSELTLGHGVAKVRLCVCVARTTCLQASLTLTLTIPNPNPNPLQASHSHALEPWRAKGVCVCVCVHAALTECTRAWDLVCAVPVHSWC